jgi:predicted RNase H-related nuclease YkuK (DUF458 family)
MDLKFKTLGDHQLVNNVVDYVKDILAEKPDTFIYVGTDSQNAKRNTCYAVVIVLHYNENDSGKGGHVLYHREYIPKIKDKHLRLWGEVERSTNVANFLKENGFNVNFIDLDFNEDPKYQSNSILRSAVGYCEALGFESRNKPGPTPACRVADSVCKA